MGWFWQASSSPKPTGSSETAAAPTSAPPPPPATSQTKPPAAETEATGADREVALFLGMLQQESQPSNTTTPPPPSELNTTTTSSPSSWLPFRSSSSSATPQKEQHPTAPPAPTRSPQSLAMSEHLLPSTMSCRDAFDYAWHCHTPGSQVNSVYRYGSVRECTELWDDFWFCMRTKSFEPAMREAAIREHYRAKEEAKYGGGKPSSEDVWESREERVQPGTAFQAKFEPPVMDDAEFQRADAERRRMLREMAERNEESKKE